VALVAPISGTSRVLDYLNYSGLPADSSYGDFPDAQPFTRQDFSIMTPGATNNPATRPIRVFINEWMADNTGTLADPASLKYEDWFELYNPDDLPVNLTGFYLTDTLTNQFQYEIPAGYVVPPKGFLLVWADNSPKRNNLTVRPDLHVNFQLSKSGEAIGLFAPDGTQIDAVTFGPQTTDVSMGRNPDGAGLIQKQTTATPGTNNAEVVVVSNTPPILASIGNQSVNEGVLLTFIASANRHRPASPGVDLQPGCGGSDRRRD